MGIWGILLLLLLPLYAHVGMCTAFALREFHLMLVSYNINKWLATQLRFLSFFFLRVLYARVGGERKENRKRVVTKREASPYASKYTNVNRC